ncbi:hypothetical protein CR162_20195, partial [Pseudoroseomonas rhizosphaerae]
MHARILQIWSDARRMPGDIKDKQAAIAEALAALRQFKAIREFAVERHDRTMEDVRLIAEAEARKAEVGAPGDIRDALIRRLLARVDTLSQAVQDLEKAHQGV